MNSVVVPINSTEQAGRVIQMASLVARAVPAPVDVLTGRAPQQPAVLASANGRAAGPPHSPAWSRHAGKGRAILAVDAAALDAHPALASGLAWGGPVLLVPGSGDWPLPERLVHILVVLIGPDTAARGTLPFAARLALGSGASLALTTVLDLGDERGYPDRQRLSDYYGAQLYLSQVADRLRARQIRATWEVRTGETAGEIVRLAETTAPDLIVASAGVGSIVPDVAAQAGTPVLLYPGRRPADG